MIVIKTQQVLIQGVKHYKVLHIKALEENDLPVEYMNGYPCVYKKGKHLYICAAMGTFILTEGSDHPVGTFRKLLKIVHEAGLRLSQINKRLAQENEGWDKDETFFV